MSVAKDNSQELDIYIAACKGKLHLLPRKLLKNKELTKIKENGGSALSAAAWNGYILQVPKEVRTLENMTKDYGGIASPLQIICGREKRTVSYKELLMIVPQLSPGKLSKNVKYFQILKKIAKKTKQRSLKQVLKEARELLNLKEIEQIDMENPLSL